MMYRGTMLSARVLQSFCLINPTIALYFVSIAVIGFAVDDGAIRSVIAYLVFHEGRAVQDVANGGRPWPRL